jgi:hypothetical protein
VSLPLGQIGETAPVPALLIVETGPAGLFAACELVRHGVKPRVVERHFRMVAAAVGNPQTNPSVSFDPLAAPARVVLSLIFISSESV